MIQWLPRIGLEGMAVKRHEGTFWNGGNSFILIGGFIGVCICQKSLSHTLEIDPDYTSIKLEKC